MEEALAAVRQAISNDETGETTLAPEPWTSRGQAGAKPTPEAGLLSREATAAVGSAFNTLTETVKKHEQSLEDVVRETLQVMAGRKLAPRGRANGAGRSRTVYSRTLTTTIRLGTS